MDNFELDNISIEVFDDEKNNEEEVLEVINYTDLYHISVENLIKWLNKN